MSRKITLRLYPDEALRKPCEVATKEDHHLIRRARGAMFKIMRQNNGAALAAPQVGIRKRFFITHDGVFINPSWSPLGEDKVFVEEGCLSFPGLFVRKERFSNIRFGWEDLKGKMHTEQLEGFKAQVVQHEVEHLEGILLID